LVFMKERRFMMWVVLGQSYLPKMISLSDIFIWEYIFNDDN
jgi:hypothetical protein